MILCNKSPLGINILVGEDACLFSIKYDGNDDKFSKPIRLVGNVLVFCMKGSISQIRLYSTSISKPITEYRDS